MLYHFEFKIIRYFYSDPESCPSRSVQFLVMFGRFEVQFWVQMRSSDMFEVWFWRFWNILSCFLLIMFANSFWWCLWGSKFSFGPKWDVRMCSKFDPLKFEVFEVQFFGVRSTSINDHLDLITTLTIGHQLLQRVTKVTKAEVPFLFCYLNSPSLSPFK